MTPAVKKPKSRRVTIPQPPQGVKPIVKVRVGGRRSFSEGCYVYLMELPARFKKIGSSVNPLKRRNELQEELGEDAPIIVAQARIFHTRGEAMGYENVLHKTYAHQRIIPPPSARSRSTEYYSPQADIHL
jgi:hypothetical protein